MSSSAQRIAVVAAVLALVTAVVLAGLGRLMIGDHAIWMERSVRNRWAFRDVPSRRGAILDGSGQVLVEDHARFALEFDFVVFRRSHPIGAALAAASLLAPEEFSFARLAAAEAACVRLLQLPVAALRDAVSDRTTAIAVRTGVRSMVAGLTGRSRAELTRELSRAMQSGDGVTVGAALQVDIAAAAAAMHERIAAVGRLAAMLRNEGGVADLEARIAARAVRYADDPDAFLLPITVIDDLRFDAAAEFACAREEWAGFSLRPAVSRDSVVDDAAPSLRRLLGQVSAVGAVDEKQRDRETARVSKMADSALRDLEGSDLLPDDVEVSVEARERMAVRLNAFVNNRINATGRIGRSGVESAMDETLQGAFGLRIIERDANARERVLHRSLDVSPGQDVQVTIDLRLQTLCERVVAAHAGEALTALAVIDAQTGDILAVAGRPLEITDREGKVVPLWVSPALSWRNAGYIGSLAKPFVLLEQLAAARDGREHKPMASFVGCAKRYAKVQGTSRWFECDGYHGERGRDPAAALAESCNVFFFQAAEGLGSEGLFRAYVRAGWVSAAAVDGEARHFQDEVPGLSGFARPCLEREGIPGPFVGIGYGVKANTLSVARAYAGLATGYLPTIGLIVGRPRAPRASLGVPAEDLALVHEGLRQCATDGTARAVEGLAAFGVWGKTGTAEVNDRVGRSGSDNNAWFAGFVMAPTGSPTLAFAAVRYTVEDHGKESAVLVRDFLQGIAGLEGGDALHRRWLLGEGGR